MYGACVIVPLIGGVIGVVGGMALLVFHRQFVAFAYARARRREQWRPILESSLYRPNAQGRVPMLYVIGVGWVVVGGILLFTTLAGRG